MFDRQRDQPPAYQHYQEDTLDWILTELQSAPNDGANFDNIELFARLEAHLAEAGPEERARLDETVYEKMSDFAAKNEMLLALRLHRPVFPRRGQEETFKMLEENSTPCTRLMIRGTRIQKSEPTAFPVESLELFEKLTPAVGRKNEAWLDCRTAERKALTSFWDKACKALGEEFSLRTSLTQEELDDSLSAMSVSKSAEYAEIVENERLQVLDAIATAALNTNTAKVETEERFWDTGPDVSPLTIEERAAKPKTRPSQPASAPANPAASLASGIATDVESIED